MLKPLRKMASATGHASFAELFKDDLSWLGALPSSGSRVLKLCASFFRGEHDGNMGTWARAGKTGKDILKEPHETNVIRQTLHEGPILVCA